MIAQLWRLPSWFASPDDKPDYQVFQAIVGFAKERALFVNSETVECPDSEHIMVQAGINDNTISVAMNYNFISYNQVWYVVTKATLVQGTVNVYEFTGTLDIYLTWLITVFNEEDALNKTNGATNRVFFKQKHVNRYAWNKVSDVNGNISGWYGIIPQAQMYLLNKHRALADIGKRPYKWTMLPTMDNNSDSYYYQNSPYTTVYYNPNNEFLSTPYQANLNADIPFILQNEADNTQTKNITVNISASDMEPFTTTFGNLLPNSALPGNVPAYPILIAKNNITTPGDYAWSSSTNMQGAFIPYGYANFNQPLPTSPSDNWHGLGIGIYTLTYNGSSVSYNTNNFDIIYVSDNYRSLPLNTLYNIASDYYVGLYLLPLPIQYWIPKYTNPSDGNTYVPLSKLIHLTAGWTTQTVPIPGNIYNGTNKQIINFLADYIISRGTSGMYLNFYPIQALPTLESRTNTFMCICNQGASAQNSAIGGTDLSNLEPALLNWFRFNVRMYGQDNLVRPMDFNYNYLSWYELDKSTSSAQTPTDPQYAMGQLNLYLTSFQITMSPPNIMITNIPMNDLYDALGSNGYLSYYHPGLDGNVGTFTAPMFHGELNLPVNAWNINQTSDSIFSINVKAEVPTPSTAWTNYMANNKNSYDTALNVSYLMAEQAQQNIQVANNTFAGDVAGATGTGTSTVLNAIGDIFSGKWGQIASGTASTIEQGFNTASARLDAQEIAPESYDEQEDKYNYLSTGKEADMTRVTNMRVSATGSINVLNNTEYCVIAEMPPAYEQLFVVNYYALHGYIVNRWAPFYFWYNRKYCNFVSIAFFTNTMYPNVALEWKGRIDQLMNKGFRVWTKASLSQMVAPFFLLNYDMVITASAQSTASDYQNCEINPQDDTEINYYQGNMTPSAINEIWMPNNEKRKTAKSSVPTTKKDMPK